MTTMPAVTKTVRTVKTRNEPPSNPLTAKDKKALRALLTPEQLAALLDIVQRGGPNAKAIARNRAASMT